MKLDESVARLRADVESGAAALSRAAADVVIRAAREVDVEGEAELRAVLTGLALRILDAQPAMAPLVHLASRAVEAAENQGRDGGEEDQDGLGAARRRIVGAARRFREQIASQRREVAERALPLLESGGRLTTFSSSSTVLASLLRAADAGAQLEVVCLESRPRSEGREIARRLTDAGITVTFAVDAAAAWWAARSRAVVLGGDSVGDAGVVNKIGSRALAASAREAGVPVHVLAARSKLLPPGFPQPLDDDRPAGEVWDAPPEVEVWNRYFEAFPADWVSGVVVEDGILSGEGLRVARRDLTVPAPVRKWARSRRGNGGD